MSEPEFDPYTMERAQHADGATVDGMPDYVWFFNVPIPRAAWVLIKAGDE